MKSFIEYLEESTKADNLKHVDYKQIPASEYIEVTIDQLNKLRDGEDVEGFKLVKEVNMNSWERYEGQLTKMVIKTSKSNKNYVSIYWPKSATWLDPFKAMGVSEKKTDAKIRIYTNSYIEKTWNHVTNTRYNK